MGCRKKHTDAETHFLTTFLLTSKGCAVFLEFKHYKPKKQKVSTKCFSVLELDELKNGTFPLEV